MSLGDNPLKFYFGNLSERIEGIIDEGELSSGDLIGRVIGMYSEQEPNYNPVLVEMLIKNRFNDLLERSYLLEEDHKFKINPDYEPIPRFPAY